MKSFAVKCENITKTYGGGDNQVMALRGVNLEVHAGELLMLAGPSGCGKTTLISIIAGILFQDSGTCELYGQPFNQLSINQQIAFRAKNVGFVFQSFNLIPSLTISENVAIPLIIRGMDRHLATEKGAELLGKVGLEDKTNVLPANLSGGQQQRVAIARALIHNPRLIVCDEPTSALDGATGHKIMEILKSVAMEGDRALIVVTHDNRIYPFADRIAKMEDGKIIKVINDYREFEG